MQNDIVQRNVPYNMLKRLTDAAIIANSKSQ